MRVGRRAHRPEHVEAICVPVPPLAAEPLIGKALGRTFAAREARDVVDEGLIERLSTLDRAILANSRGELVRQDPDDPSPAAILQRLHANGVSRGDGAPPVAPARSRRASSRSRTTP